MLLLAKLIIAAEGDEAFFIVRGVEVLGDSILVVVVDAVGLLAAVDVDLIVLLQAIIITVG